MAIQGVKDSPQRLALVVRPFLRPPTIAGGATAVTEATPVPGVAEGGASTGLPTGAEGGTGFCGC